MSPQNSPAARRAAGSAARRPEPAPAAPAPTATVKSLPAPGEIGEIVVKDAAVHAFDPVGSIERVVAALGNNVVARILGVSASQPGRWRRGTEAISAPNRRRLADLDHVLDRLLLELYPDQAGTWLTSPNAHLGGATPVDVLSLRGAAAVLDAIDALATGAFA